MGTGTVGELRVQEVKETLEEAARDRDAAVHKVKTLEVRGMHA